MDWGTRSPAGVSARYWNWDCMVGEDGWRCKGWRRVDIDGVVIEGKVGFGRTAEGWKGGGSLEMCRWLAADGTTALSR